MDGERAAGEAHAPPREADQVVLGEPCPRDPGAVDEGAVVTPEVDELPRTVAVAHELGVLPRDLQVLEHDVVARGAADAHHPGAHRRRRRQRRR